jgi:hypothetical protein
MLAPEIAALDDGALDHLGVFVESILVLLRTPGVTKPSRRWDIGIRQSSKPSDLPTGAPILTKGLAHIGKRSFFICTALSAV